MLSRVFLMKNFLEELDCPILFLDAGVECVEGTRKNATTHERQRPRAQSIKIRIPRRYQVDGHVDFVRVTLVFLPFERTRTMDGAESMSDYWLIVIIWKRRCICVCLQTTEVYMRVRGTRQGRRSRCLMSSGDELVSVHTNERKKNRKRITGWDRQKKWVDVRRESK